MGKSDYYRPAPYQIRQIGQCSQCRAETEYLSDQDISGARCHCGGAIWVSGESYPASSDDWHEERDSVNDEWHERRS